MNINPIEPRLRPLLDEFLAHEDYQDRITAIARKVGYKGDDKDKIKVALFTPNEDNEVCFISNEAAELFTEFQIVKEVSAVEPYKTLLEVKPEAKPEVVRIAKELLQGKTPDMDEILALFPTEEK